MISMPTNTHQFQQQMFPQQHISAQHSMQGMGDPGGISEFGVDAQFPSTGQTPILNLLQQQQAANHRGSGSNTPITTMGTTSSPKTTVGAGRGGRRKSAVGTNQTATTSTGAGRLDFIYYEKL